MAFDDIWWQGLEDFRDLLDSQAPIAAIFGDYWVSITGDPGSKTTSPKVQPL